MSNFIKQVKAIGAANQVITPEMVLALLDQHRIPDL
jgi:hypothetical protein